jgi:hypothetical protein
VGIQAVLVELLLAGFFAVACFRARAAETGLGLAAPHRLLTLTDRLERLRRSRWQWFSMVLVLVVVRMQRGAPITAEMTALAELILFLALPTQTTSPGAGKA